MADSEEGKATSSTLFVRNLSFDASAPQLESLFSDIGPVRQCYIVTDPGKKTSRGFGYVHVRLFPSAVHPPVCHP